MFIVIEGPRGVGKTTVAELLGVHLAAREGMKVCLTSEPIQAAFGHTQDLRGGALSGRALALVLAAFRAERLDSAIIPALDDGKFVVSERYVQSSLVLQRADGMELDEIWSYNQYCLPAVSFYLEDDEEAIRQRLHEQGRPGVLGTSLTPQRELQLYRDAGRYLGRPAHDWVQHYIDCRGRTPSEVVATILGLLPQQS